MRAEAGRLARLCVALFIAASPVLADGVLEVGNPGKPATLDPHRITGVWENRIVGDMFTGLVTEGPDGSIRPGAAESWTVSDDGLEYRFVLRQQTWSDGEPLTAEDFAWSFARMLSPETASAYADFFYAIVGARERVAGGDSAGLGVRAEDERHLVIELERPVAYFPGLLTHFAALPVPRHVIEAHGDGWTEPGVMVSNGPFVLARRVPNAYVELVRNPRFFAAGSVSLDGVRFHVQEDRDAAVNRYRAGALQILYDFPGGKTPWLEKTLPGEVHTRPYLGLSFIAVNQRRDPLASRAVRTALSMAVERQVITDRLLASGERPAYSLVPSGTANYGEPARVAWAEWPRGRRVAAARRLMAEAGYGDDHPLALGLRFAGSETERRIAVALQAMWKEIGVEVELERAETAVHYSRLSAGDFDLGLASWLAVYDDPQTFTLLLQSTTTANNFGRYANPEYDRLTARAAGTVDLERRARLLRRAEALALEQQGLIPLFHHASRNLVSPRVTGWRDNLLDVHRSRYLGLRSP